MDEDLKDLPPEERIKRLKKLEEEKKKEIAEAEKLIHESEDEITERAKFKEKVPIPEVASEETTGLSQEAKDILKEERGIKEKEETAEVVEKKIEEDLEETVMREEPKEIPREIIQSQYTLHLSKEPLQEIHNEMKDIYRAVEEKGYLNKDEERKIKYLSSAVELKLKDAEAGRYSLTADVAKEASLTQRLSGSLLGMYQTKNNKMYRA